jgi:drug/metabolite transporter (DMT)-like permease
MGFVAQRLGMDHVSPMQFTAARFGLGAASLLVFGLAIRVTRKNQPTQVHDGSRGTTILGGCLAGLTLFFAAAFQQFGIAGTTAGNAGFITGLYVVFVPALGILIGRIPDRAAACGALIALIGLYFLSITSGMSMSWGDGLVLISAVFWAIHVLLIGWLAPRVPALRLNFIQFSVTAILASSAVFLVEEIDFTQIMKALPAILYSGILAVAVAFGLQTVAQKVASPTRTAVLLSTEALFAAAAGFLLLSEVFTIRQSFGGILMLTGVLVTILLSNKHRTASNTELHESHL